MNSSALQLERYQAQDLQRRATPTTFLSLPVEIRLQIYRHCVPRGYFIFNNASSVRPEFDFVFYEDRALYILRRFPQGPFTTDLLVVCRQVSEECLGILYGENLFEMDLARGAQSVFRSAFTEENIMRIRNVRVIARLAAPPPDMRLLPQPDHQFWSMVIPQLRRFVLQANEPATCVDATVAHWDVDRVLERRLLDDWKERVELYFDLFGMLLGDVTRNIKVDISVGSETLGIVRRHIPGNYPVRVVNRFQCICGRGCTQRG